MKGKPYSIQISEEAENDFDKSYEYYYDNSPNVANAFFHLVNDSLEIIKTSPLSFQKIHKSLRKFTIKKFPFVIYYQVVDYAIQIIAIFHSSRNPKIWTKRIHKNIT
jgi:addiction module RelE/StbE family toxin